MENTNNNPDEIKIGDVEYYTFGQAMSLLDFSKRTMQRKMKRREIQFLKLGRDKFFHPDAIDESPMAYKPMDEIIRNIHDTADIVKIIKPVYNFKAAE